MSAKAELKAKLSLDTSSFSKSLSKARAQAAAFGSGLAKSAGSAAIRGLGLITIAATAAAAALAIGVKQAYDLGSALQDAADKTGIAADQIMILQQAAKDNGIDDITGAIAKMQKNLTDAAKKGAGPAAEALQELGLSADDLINKLPAEQLQKIGEKIMTIRNPAVRAAEAMAIFGKSGKDLLPLFADAEAIDTASRSIGRQAQLFKEHSQDFDKISDRMGRIHLKLQGFAVGVATSILPAIDKLTKKFDALDLAAQGERFGRAITPVLDRIASIDFGKMADGLVTKMQATLTIAEKIRRIFSPTETIRVDEILGKMDDKPEAKKPVERNYGVGQGSSFFAGRDPRDRNTGIFAKQLPGPVKAFATPPISPFGRGVDPAAIRKKEYDDLVKRFGEATVAKWSMERKVGRPVPHSSALSSGGLTSGGLTSGGLGPAYGQRDILSHRERMRDQNAAVASGAMGRDERRSAPNAHDVIRRGDRSRAQNVAREEARKKLTLEGVNDRLDVLIDQGKSSPVVKTPQGGSN